MGVGPDADRHDKPLTSLIWAGSFRRADSQTSFSRHGAMFHNRARVVSKSKNKARALWYLAPTRDFSRPSIMTFPEPSHTRHSQSLRFRLIATSKSARSSIRG
jgi:hypothetical protein